MLAARGIGDNRLGDVCQLLIPGRSLTQWVLMPIYRVERVKVHQSELRTTLLDRLRRNVFHVTTQEAWPLIRSRGLVSSNPPDHPVIKKWEYNAYFRQKSHVSLCDLRSVRESDLQMALDNYFFLGLGGARADPVFLILSSSSINRIVTNDEAIDDAREAEQMFVPSVEAGYPGDLPLAEITDVLIVDIDRPPPSPFVRVLQHLCGTEDTDAAGRGRR